MLITFNTTEYCVELNVNNVIYSYVFAQRRIPKCAVMLIQTSYLPIKNEQMLMVKLL